MDELEPHIIIKGGMLQTNALVHVFFFFFFPFGLPLDQSASIKRIFGEWFIRIVERACRLGWHVTINYFFDEMNE